MIRPFRRSDREQLIALVNAHIAAVVPGVSVSVNALMSQLEREPAEAIVDPWVVERETFVGVERDTVVAGAHLLRYADEERVGDSYRGRRYVRWLVARPDAPDAAAALLESLDIDGLDVGLPAPFVYGVPDVWPHIRALLAQAGFVPSRTEVVLVAEVDDLPDAPFDARRSVGPWTWIRLESGDAYIDLETDFTAGGTLSRFAGWADIGNLVAPDDETRRDTAFYTANGFRELVRTECGWERRP